MQIDDAMKAMNDIDLHIESMREPTSYYYKRWLWIMFPWACIQTDKTFSYSTMIAKCYSSNIRYLSVTEDRLLTNHSVNIVREIKSKKQKVLGPGGEEDTANLNKSVQAKDSMMSEKKVFRINPLNGRILGAQTQRSNSQISGTQEKSNNNQLKQKLNNVQISQDEYNLNTGTQSKFQLALKTQEHGGFFSTLGGKSSMFGTKRSDFFGELEANPDQLNRFRTSQINSSRTDRQTRELKKVSSILKRTPYTGQQLQKDLFSDKSKNVLLQQNNLDALKTIRQTLQEHNHREVGNLDKKSNDLAAELNVLRDSVGKKQKVYTQMMDTYNRMASEISKESQQAYDDTKEVTATIERLDEQYNDQRNAEDRMNRIIDICNVNKTQTDEWLRKINMYSQNLQQCIQDQESELKTLAYQRVTAENKLPKMFSQLKTQEAERSALLTSLQQLQEQNASIQKHFLSTDNMVTESMINTRRQLEEITKDKLRLLEEEKKENLVQERNREIREKLRNIRAVVGRYQDLFKPGENSESWYSKPETKKMLENLNLMRELERNVMQRKFDLEDVLLRNNDIERKINVELA